MQSFFFNPRYLCNGINPNIYFKNLNIMVIIGELKKTKYFKGLNFKCYSKSIKKIKCINNINNLMIKKLKKLKYFKNLNNVNNLNYLKIINLKNYII